MYQRDIHAHMHLVCICCGHWSEYCFLKFETVCHLFNFLYLAFTLEAFPSKSDNDINARNERLSINTSLFICPELGDDEYFIYEGQFHLMTLPSLGHGAPFSAIPTIHGLLTYSPLILCQCPHMA